MLNPYDIDVVLNGETVGRYIVHAPDEHSAEVVARDYAKRLLSVEIHPAPAVIDRDLFDIALFAAPPT